MTTLCYHVRCMTRSKAKQLAAAVARITIAPEWRDAVRANLAVTFRLAAMVDAFKLPDEAEPASVFTA